MNNEIDHRIRETHSLHVEVRERMERMVWKKLEERREVPGRIHLDDGQLPDHRIAQQKSLKLPPKLNALFTAAASVIDLRLFLQFAQENPCCRLI